MPSPETLATKLLPPATPPTLLARPQLEERLRDALTRRLTTVIAGAGFGKSTVLSAWTAELPAAWYSLTPDDASLSALARGVVDALRLRVPGLPADIAGALGGARGPDAGVDEAARGRAFAALLSQALQEHLPRDLVLVLDDVDEAAGGRGAVELVDALCRHAPPTLHLVLAARAELPFRIDRLRGQGQVLELGAADLAFTREETGALLAEITGEPDLAAAEAIFLATEGWPAAVRLAVESLVGVPPDQRAAVVERIGRPGGSLFAYLAAEVFSRLPPEAELLVRTTARLEGFTPELCDELGVPDAQATIGALARRGLFVEPRGRQAGWFSLNGLVREYARTQLPLADEELRRAHAAAAEWLEEHDHVEAALRALEEVDDRHGLAGLLERRGGALLAGGAVDAIVRAVALLPPAARSPEIEQLAGQAHQVRGEWEAALEALGRAAAGAGRVPPGIAWRMGLIHHLRGELDEALSVYGRGAEEEGEGRDRALLLAWRASALWLRGEADACRADATAAFEAASEAADPGALAAAHTVLAMLAALDGDRAANDGHYLRALDYAQGAGDVLQLIRVRTNRGSRHTEEGAYEEAVAELDIALRLADLAGFASFKALALSNRGEARARLGRFEEAVADLEESRALYERLGSRLVAYPLEKLGEVYWERGDWTLARAALEEAVRHSEAGGDVQGLVPSLAALARVLAFDEPAEAAELAARAVAFGPGMGHARALLAQGWIALARGDGAEAVRLGGEASAAGRARRDRGALAESLELQALADPARASAAERLEEASALWRELGSPVGAARADLAQALLAGDGEAAAAALETLRSLGARGYGPLLTRLLGRHEEAPLEIQALGRFRLLRHGRAVPLAEWQSRKARDLLKLLVARRGRPVTREQLMEVLWPEQDPAKLGNRLSVALSTVRSVLDPEKRYDPDHFVAGDRDTVSLQAERVAVDVERFLADGTRALQLRRAGAAEAGELLARTEALYSGDFLEENAYDDWAITLREEARSVYVDVALALAEDASGCGDADAAVRYFLRVLEKDPYDERAHLGLVSALEAAGRHGEARRHFRAYAARMDELGIESAPFPVS